MRSKLRLLDIERPSSVSLGRGGSAGHVTFVRATQRVGDLPVPNNGTRFVQLPSGARGHLPLMDDESQHV